MDRQVKVHVPAFTAVSLVVVQVQVGLVRQDRKLRIEKTKQQLGVDLYPLANILYYGGE